MVMKMRSRFGRRPRNGDPNDLALPQRSSNSNSNSNSICIKRKIPMAVAALLLLSAVVAFEMTSITTPSTTVPEDEESSGAPSHANENNLFPGLVQSGDGWSLWDRETALSHNGVVKCEWVKFASSTGASAGMCTYPASEDIWVSKTIAKVGRWSECDDLTKMWNQLVPENDRIKPVSDYYFLDIGVNIGACLIEVLLSTNARIIGFEADPRNAVQVTTTLMAQPKDIRDRVAFFPVGLGSVSSWDSVIHQASDNRGHSVVDAAIKDHSQQVMLPPIPIVLERLDAILPQNSPIFSAGNSNRKLKLIKMDVEGFECNVVDGGRHVFEASRAIKTELDEGFLNLQNCSASGLMSRLEKAGFPKQVDLPSKPKMEYKVIKPKG